MVLNLFLEMDKLFVLLHYFMIEFLFFLVTIAILLLLIEFFEQSNLSIQFLNDSLLFLDLILENVNLFSIKILKFIAKLIKLFPEYTVLFYFVFQLLFCNLAPWLHRFMILLFRLLLNLFQYWVQLLIQLLELCFEWLVLAFLFLNQLQPD